MHIIPNLGTPQQQPKIKQDNLLQLLYSLASIQLLCINIPRVFHYIPFVVYMIQTHLISYWLPFHKTYTSVGSVLCEIFFLDPLNPQFASDAYDYSLMVINFLFILTFFGGFVMYSKIKFLYYKVDYFCVFFFDIFIPIVFIPTGAQIGLHAGDISQNFGTYQLIIMLFASLMLAAILPCLYIILHTYAVSIYIKDSPFTCFDGNYVFLSYLIPIATQIIQRLEPMLSNSIKKSVIVTHMVVMLLLVVWSFWPPHSQIQATILYSANFLSVAVLDLIELISPLSKDYQFSFALVTYLVSCIIMTIAIKLRVHFILKHNTKKDIVLRFRLAMITNTGFDEALVDFSIDNAENDVQRLQLARFCSLFPEFQARSYELITLLKKVRTYSVFNAFLQQELIHLQMLRQTYCQVSELDEMRELNALICCLHKLTWQKIRYKETFFRDCEILHRKINKGIEQWNILIQKYPNNAIVAFNYSRFLFDCVMDYENAAAWHYKSMQLEEGKKFQYDEGVIHLLRSYPFFYTRVLNNTPLNNLNDLEVNIKNQILGKITTEPELRIELQHTIASIRPQWLSCITFLNTVKVLFTISIWIFCITKISTTFDRGSESLNLMRNTGILCNSASLSVVSALSQKMMPSISNSSTADSIINLTDLNQRIMYAYRGLYYFEEIMNWSCSNPTSDSINKILFDYNLTSQYSNGFSYTPNYSTPFLSNEIYFISSMITSTVFRARQVIISGNYLNDMLNDLLDEICIFACNIADSEQRSNMNLFIGCASSSFVLFIALYYIFYLLYFLYLNNLKKSLKSIPQETIEKVYDKSDSSRDIGMSTVGSNFSVTVLIFVVDFLLTLVMISGQALFYSRMGEQIRFYRSLSVVLLSAIQRETRSYQIMYDASCALSYPDIKETLLLHMRQKMSEMLEAHTRSKTGDIYNYIQASNRLNEAHSMNKCNGTVDEGNKECLSVDSAVVSFLESAKRFVADNASMSRYSSMFLYLFSYYSHSFDDIIDIVLSLAFDQKEENMSDIFRPGLGFIFCAVISLLIGLLLELHMANIFKAILYLLLKLQPTDLVENRLIINYLFSTKINEKAQSNSEEVILNSGLPTIFLNREGIVELINSSFSSSFEYDPLHIVGQNLTTFVSCENIANLFDSIQHRAVESLLVDKCMLTKGNGKSVECEITMIPYYESKMRMKFCTLIFAEKHALKCRQKQCEDLKRHCEELINSIKELRELTIGDCSVCCFKFSNFELKKVNYFENLFNDICEIMDSFCDLQQIILGNGIFCVVCKSPEASLRCVEFSEKVVEYIEEKDVHCGFSAIIAKGNMQNVPITVDDREINLVYGPLVCKLRTIIEMHKMGQIIVTQEVFDELLGHDFEFHKEEGNVPCFSLNVRNQPVFY